MTRAGFNLLREGTLIPWLLPQLGPRSGVFITYSYLPKPSLGFPQIHLNFIPTSSDLLHLKSVQIVSWFADNALQERASSIRPSG